MRQSVLVTVGSFIFGLVGFFTALIAIGESSGMSRLTSDVVMYGLATLVCFGVAFFCLKVIIPTLELKERLAKIRPFKGRDRRDVVGVLGRPDETRNEGDGVSLLTWASPRYSVTLRFEDGSCVGVAHEKRAT